MYKHRARVKAKNPLFLLGSILLHLILFFMLSISNLGIKKSSRRDQFELNAIKVANLAPQAKDKRSTKGDTKSGKRVRKKSKQRPQKRPKTVSKKQTKLAKLSHHQPKNISKQVKFKATKKVTMIEKTIRQQKYTINRKAISKKQLKANLNKPTVKTFQETTTSMERVTKVQTITKVREPQIKIKTWQQNVTQKQVDKQLKPVKPTIQRQVVVKQQMEYRPRDKNQPIKLAQNRLTYKQETKSLDRRAIEVPEPLEMEEVKTITQVTKFRRVTKQTTVVTRVEEVPILKNSLALEQIPLKNNIKKGSQQVKLEPQREVSLKQFEYEERISSAEPVKVSQAKVTTYEQKSTEQSKKVITTTPEISTEIIPTEATAVAVSITTAVKQAFEADPVMAQATSITQLSTAVPDERQATVEKTTSLTTNQMPTKNVVERKLDIQNTATSQKQLVAFKTTQSDSLSTPMTDSSASGSDEGEVNIEAELPSGNITNNQLHRLIGTIDSDVKTAFLTVNDVTQLITVVDGTFVAEVALAQGTNNLNIMAFNSRGKMGRKSFQLLFNAPVKGIPTIRLDSPENGRQGVKQGETIIVEGTIDDPSISKAILLLNRTPIPLTVKNGRFRRRITLPSGTIFVFRVMAQNRDGVRAFSPAHTVLSTYDIDIVNPRPY